MGSWLFSRYVGLPMSSDTHRPISLMSSGSVTYSAGRRRSQYRYVSPARQNNIVDKLSVSWTAEARNKRNEYESAFGHQMFQYVSIAPSCCFLVAQVIETKIAIHAEPIMFVGREYY